MASVLKKFKKYYQLFGMQGLALALKTRLAAKPRQVSLNLRQFSHPLHFRLKTTDVPTFKKIFWDKEYEYPLRKDPQVIVDAGANIGFASIFFAQKYPSAKIIAIEPEAENFELLRKNTQSYKNITLVKGALWKENNLLDLVDPGIGPWGFQAHDTSSGSSKVVVGKVEGFTLERIMEKFGLAHIDILKVDIEGGEKQLFEQSNSWLNKVGVIMIELHDSYNPGCSQTFYSATKGFGKEDRKGENVFLLRPEYAV